MSINTAISEKVIKLYKGHLFAIKMSFLGFKRVVNSFFIKEIHFEQILKAKDLYFSLRERNKISACYICKFSAATPLLLKAIVENQSHHIK